MPVRAPNRPQARPRVARARAGFALPIALLVLALAACADAKPTPTPVATTPTTLPTAAPTSRVAPSTSPDAGFAPLRTPTAGFAPIGGLTPIATPAAEALGSPSASVTARAPLPTPIPEAGLDATASPTPSAPPSPSPSPTPPPTPSPTPVATPIVPDATPPAALQPGVWASVNTRGGCLNVRLSLDPTSLLLDCLPYGTLVFVDDIQKTGGDSYAHLSGEGFAFPAGLTPTTNPAEHLLPFAARPTDLGRIAYTTVEGDLWTVDGDGANPKQVVSANQSLGAYYSALAWSPGGTRLLLQRDAPDGRVIQVYDGSGQPRTVFPPTGGDPTRTGVAAWASDDGHALVASYDSGGDACGQPSNTLTIASVDLASGSVTPLLQQFRPGYVAAISASPDGARAALLFGTSCDAKSFNLCLLDLRDDAALRTHSGALSCPGISVGEVAWSGDGRYLAYTGRVQARDDESALATDLPLGIYDTRLASFYPLAYPLRYDSNVIGLAWESDGRTLDIEEEVPRGLADVELPDRVLRRVSVDGSTAWAVLLRGDPLLSVRPVLAPGQTHAGYALATGARGELWVIRMGSPDARWQISPDAIGVAAWSP